MASCLPGWRTAGCWRWRSRSKFVRVSCVPCHDSSPLLCVLPHHTRKTQSRCGFLPSSTQLVLTELPALLYSAARFFRLIDRAQTPSERGTICTGGAVVKSIPTRRLVGTLLV